MPVEGPHSSPFFTHGFCRRALNRKHIANAHELPRIYELLDREGLGRLLICTPAEFLGDSDDEQQSDT